MAVSATYQTTPAPDFQPVSGSWHPHTSDKVKKHFEGLGVKIADVAGRVFGYFNKQNTHSQVRSEDADFDDVPYEFFIPNKK